MKIVFYIYCLPHSSTTPCACCARLSAKRAPRVDPRVLRQHRLALERLATRAALERPQLEVHLRHMSPQPRRRWECRVALAARKLRGVRVRSPVVQHPPAGLVRLAARVARVALVVRGHVGLQFRGGLERVGAGSAHKGPLGGVHHAVLHKRAQSLEAPVTLGARVGPLRAVHDGVPRERSGRWERRAALRALVLGHRGVVDLLVVQHPRMGPIHLTARGARVGGGLDVCARVGPQGVDRLERVGAGVARKGPLVGVHRGMLRKRAQPLEAHAALAALVGPLRAVHGGVHRERRGRWERRTALCALVLGHRLVVDPLVVQHPRMGPIHLAARGARVGGGLVVRGHVAVETECRGEAGPAVLADVLVVVGCRVDVRHVLSKHAVPLEGGGALGARKRPHIRVDNAVDLQLGSPLEGLATRVAHVGTGCCHGGGGGGGCFEGVGIGVLCGWRSFVSVPWDIADNIPRNIGAIILRNTRANSRYAVDVPWDIADNIPRNIGVIILQNTRANSRHTVPTLFHGTVDTQPNTNQAPQYQYSHTTTTTTVMASTAVRANNDWSGSEDHQHPTWLGVVGIGPRETTMWARPTAPAAPAAHTARRTVSRLPAARAPLEEGVRKRCAWWKRCEYGLECAFLHSSDDWMYFRMHGGKGNPVWKTKTCTNWRPHDAAGCDFYHPGTDPMWCEATPVNTVRAAAGHEAAGRSVFCASSGATQQRPQKTAWMGGGAAAPAAALLLPTPAVYAGTRATLRWRTAAGPRAGQNFQSRAWQAGLLASTK